MSTYLEERINWYDENYRNGNALISDAQFDQLENNLKRVRPNCDYFTNKKALPLPSLPTESELMTYCDFFKNIADTN